MRTALWFMVLWLEVPLQQTQNICAVEECLRKQGARMQYLFVKAHFLSNSDWITLQLTQQNLPSVSWGSPMLKNLRYYFY